jgi:guanylate kinase
MVVAIRMTLRPTRAGTRRRGLGIFLSMALLYPYLMYNMVLSMNMVNEDSQVLESATAEIEKQKERGVLLVLSGPSGVGKDTVMLKLMAQYPNMTKLVTTNSRPKRDDEKEGFDYHFVSREEFEKLIADEAFFEWVEYRSHYRGGQKKHVQEALSSGHDVIWRIDVRGVKNIREKVKEMFPHSAFVMLAVNDLETLRARMEERQSESAEGVSWSMDMAEWEQRQWHDFDYVVANEDGDLEAAVVKIGKIVEATRMQVAR